MAKIVYFYGKTEEEVKNMSLDEFKAFLSPGERRHLARGMTEAEKAVYKHLEKGSKKIKTHARTLVLEPRLLGKVISVYNGKDFVDVEITLERLGHRIGEFAPSTKKVQHSSAGVGASKSSKNQGRK
ncbi:MAG: ribosomal protein S19 family protein [Candidatus Nanoarchaeia archaeon]|nr:ribosomal protein S19 family protein [Candidatus Nanoarchaeia archaeon]